MLIVEEAGVVRGSEWKLNVLDHFCVNLQPLYKVKSVLKKLVQAKKRLLPC
jgi:hypothetical protein